MPGCEGWDAFCAAAGNSTGFPALCSNQYVAPPGPEQAAPAAVPAPAAAKDSTAAAAAAPSSCYDDPSSAACASFAMPEAEVAGNLTALCASMPNMVGCTLQSECQVRREQQREG